MSSLTMEQCIPLPQKCINTLQRSMREVKTLRVRNHLWIKHNSNIGAFPITAVDLIRIRATRLRKRLGKGRPSFPWLGRVYTVVTIRLGRLCKLLSASTLAWDGIFHSMLQLFPRQHPLAVIRNLSLAWKCHYRSLRPCALKSQVSGGACIVLGPSACKPPKKIHLIDLTWRTNQPIMRNNLANKETVTSWNAIVIRTHGRLLCMIVITLHLLLQLLPQLSLRPRADSHRRRFQQRLSTEVSLLITYWLATQHAITSLLFRRSMHRLMQLVQLPLYQIIEVLILIH